MGKGDCRIWGHTRGEGWTLSRVKGRKADERSYQTREPGEKVYERAGRLGGRVLTKGGREEGGEPVGPKSQTLRTPEGRVPVPTMQLP